MNIFPFADGTAISEFTVEEGRGVVISCYGNWFVEDHPGSQVVWSKKEHPFELNGKDDKFNIINCACRIGINMYLLNC